MESPRFLRASSIGLAAIFLLFGLMKFSPAAAEGFERWGYPAGFQFVVGVAELIAASLLAIPRTRLSGALLVIPPMIGAIVRHLRVPEIGILPLALACLVLASMLVWKQRDALPMR